MALMKIYRMAVGVTSTRQDEATLAFCPPE